MTAALPTIETLLRYHEWVRTLARSLVTDPARADDVAQQTMLEAIERPPQNLHQPKGWLATVARNTARALALQDRRRRHREQAVARSEAIDADPAAFAHRAAAHKQVVDAVFALPEPYRSVVLLRYFEGLDAQQIAVHQDRPVATVRTQLQRGLERMRQRLDRDFGDRQSWCAALLPLLAKQPAVVAVPILSSAVSIGMWKWTVPAAFVIASLFFMRPLLESSADPAPQTTTPLASSAGEYVSEGRAAKAMPAHGTDTSKNSPLLREALTNPTSTEDPGVAERPYELQVLVCDESGTPVQGAHIVLSRDGSEQLSDQLPPTEFAGMTDAVGTASLLVKPGIMNAAAMKVGVGVSSFVWFGRLSRLRIELSTLDVEISGRVVDHLDRGVKDAEVSMQQSSRHFMRTHRPRPDGTQLCPVHAATKTASDGSFSFRASSTWGVCALFAKAGPFACRPIETEPGEQGSRHLRMEVPGRFVLRGIVLDWRGQPVAACEVYADQPAKQANGYSEGHTVTTDAAGKFEIPFLTSGRCSVAALGSETLPAGPTVAVELAAAGTGWVELHTKEPATLQCTVAGCIDDQPTRILVRPQDDNLAGMREVQSIGNEPCVVHGLMHGVVYNVFVFQGDDVRAEATVAAGVMRSIELRGAPMRGDAVLVCEVTGEGRTQLVDTKVMISVHPWHGLGRGQLGAELGAQQWRRGTSVRLDDLPATPAAIAVMTVDGVELARSAPFGLSHEPAEAMIHLNASGTIEVTATIAPSAMCFAQVLHADGSPMLSRGPVRLQPSRAFRCTIPSGRYLVRITTEDKDGSKVDDMPCLVAARETVCLRPW